jgi:hypothetical protein
LVGFADDDKPDLVRDRSCELGHRGVREARAAVEV